MDRSFEKKGKFTLNKYQVIQKYLPRFDVVRVPLYYNEKCMCSLRNIALESVTEKCDRRTTDKVIPMCHYALQATQKVELLSCYYNHDTVTYLWKVSCSELRSIWLESSLSTFSLSFSSSCCDVSIQYSAVHRMLQIRHCSSSVNLVTSPSFSILWIRPDAELMPLLWLDALQVFTYIYMYVK